MAGVILLLCLILVIRVRNGAAAQEELCQGEFLPVATPLTELGNAEYVRMEGGLTGYRGGLYPDGANARPPEHEAAGLAAAARIQPLDETGQPSPDGKIVLMSVGMSNTSSEFNGFMSLAHERRLDLSNPSLVLVNGAQGGRVSEWWADPESAVWPELDGRLHHMRVSHAQVQAVWIKLTQTRGGDFPAKAEALQADLIRVVQNLKTYFPNLQIAYLSSRTRSYMYWRGLSPEPVAYETGFAVKWLIEAQINGEPELNFDPAKGEVRAPFLSWGPYLWIDGENARADGYTWLAADLIRDCTHPSRAGVQKIASMLFEFFQSDTTARSWFTGAAAPVTEAPPTVTMATATTPMPTATTMVAATATPPESPTLTVTTERGVPVAAATHTAVARLTPTTDMAEPVSSGAQSRSTALLPLYLSLLFLLLAGAGVWWRSHHI